MSGVAEGGCTDGLFPQLLTLQFGITVVMGCNEALQVYGFFGPSSYLYIQQQKNESKCRTVSIQLNYSFVMPTSLFNLKLFPIYFMLAVKP